MASDERFSAMKKFVEETLNEPGSHGFDHTLRVTSLCIEIGTDEQANMDILLPAAIFHDIARPMEKKSGTPHEEEGAIMAECYLKSIQYPDEYIGPVIHAIKAHRFSTQLVPETLEAKILSDADKIDAIGAVGIARTFISAGERNGDITDAMDHIHEKLLNLKDLMYTQAGKRITETRHDFLVSFVRTINDEMNNHDFTIPGSSPEHKPEQMEKNNTLS